ncbi:MAG TPA: YqgE/AlgH family protein [Gaiellaceae bacterium]|jgi:putative transcriptional regulator|nr:YqgE/AlgH family protein [Gaiellaceae bacterium]
MDSLQGRLLVSSPSLLDPHFRRTVVLIAHHDEEGAMGLVLTRPSDVAAVDAVPALAGLPGADDAVHVGGPVQPEAFMVLAEFEDVTEAAAPIFEGVGFVPAEAEPEDLSIRRLRLFSGYAGWSAGQLELELAEPSAWIVVPAVADDAFADDPDALWRTVLHRAGRQYEVMEHMPFDPHLN